MINCHLIWENAYFQKIRKGETSVASGIKVKIYCGVCIPPVMWRPRKEKQLVPPNLKLIPSGILEEEKDGQLSTVRKHSQKLEMISNL